MLMNFNSFLNSAILYQGNITLDNVMLRCNIYTDVDDAHV